MKFQFKISKSRLFKRDFLILLVSIFLFNSAQAQDSIDVRKRVLYTAGVEVVGYSGIMYGLNKAWYAGYPRSNFHFFNDNNEWLQMDKIGHFGSTYYLGKLGYEAIKWTGVDNKKAIWWGGTTGFAYLTIIEILDGFSSEWGASPGDLIANTSGAAMFIGQQLAWDEQRIIMKFSFTPSSYSKYRPEALGISYGEQLIKDYNGQTYWLSVNPNSFGLVATPSQCLKFINIAFGYSGDGMTGGSANPLVNSAGQSIPSFNRERQYYLSLDFDLSRISVKKKWLKRTLSVVNLIKIPTPAISYQNSRGFGWHWLYF